MKEVIIALFGEYAPTMTQHAFVLTDEMGQHLEYVDVIASGLAGLDWPWIAGVALFGLTLYCVLRLLGGALK